MINLHEKSEGFKLQYEKFLHGCDALEQRGDWNVSSNGDMESYYFNDIMCVIVLLISSDGEFTDAEATFINDAFGFRYSAEELKELYRTNGSDIKEMLEVEIPAGYKKLKSINPKLAEHYRNMLFLVCDIIAESDGIIHIGELKEIDAIKSNLAD